MELKLFLNRTIPQSIVSISNSTLNPVVAIDRDPFIDWPIEIRYYSFTPHDAGMLPTVSSMSTEISATAGIIIILIVHAKSGNQLKNLLTNSMYQAALGGPEVLLPERLLRGLRDSQLLPFEVDHHLKVWMSKNRPCEPHPILQINEIACDFLDNYGEDIMVISAVFILSSMISLASYYVSKSREKKNKLQAKVRPVQINSSKKDKPHLIKEVALTSKDKQSISFQIMQAIDSKLGLRYFIIFLDGFHLEIFPLILINLYHIRSTPQTITSIFVGFLATIYYFAISIRILRMASRVYSLIRSEESASLEEVMHRQKLEILEVLFEGFARPRSKLALVRPVFEVSRSLLISLSVFLLLSYPWCQVVLAFLVECGMMWLVLKLRVRQSRLHNWVEYFVCASNIIYLILKAVTLCPIDDKTRQVYLRFPMVGIILLNGLINLLFVLISIVELIGGTISQICKKDKQLKKTPTTQAHPIEQKTPVDVGSRQQSSIKQSRMPKDTRLPSDQPRSPSIRGNRASEEDKRRKNEGHQNFTNYHQLQSESGRLVNQDSISPGRPRVIHWRLQLQLSGVKVRKFVPPRFQNRNQQSPNINAVNGAFDSLKNPSKQGQK